MSWPEEFDQLWPIAAVFGPMLVDVGQNLPTFEHGRPSLAGSGLSQISSNELDTTRWGWPRVEQCSANLVHKMLTSAKRGPHLAHIGQIWPKFYVQWPAVRRPVWQDSFGYFSRAPRRVVRHFLSDS